MRILIVDDHPMFRRGLIRIISDKYTDELLVFSEAGCGEDAIEMSNQHSYDLAVLDLSMPGIGGLATLEILRHRFPQLPILILSMFTEDQFAVNALKLGASGYINKMEADEELLLAIKTVFEGRRYLSHSLSTALIEQATQPKKVEVADKHSTLSKREYEILLRVTEGQSLKIIAHELNLSIKTISTYKYRLFSKMGFHSLADLIAYSLKNSTGLLKQSVKLADGSSKRATKSSLDKSTLTQKSKSP